MKALYDGMSRAPLRAGLGVIGSLDAVVLAWQVHRTARNDLSHPFAPDFLLALHDRPMVLALIAGVAIAGFVAFAWRRSPIASGVLAIVALAVLSESHAALVGGPARTFYTVGAVTSGWLFGLAYARGVTTGDLRVRTPGEERLAELGAVGVFAATYVGAGTSKLLLGGVEWTDANHLRAIVVSQHPVADHSILGRYADAVANHGGLAVAFGLAALVVQLGAFMLLVSPLTRTLWTVAILGFHLNTLLLLHIIYPEAFAIAVLFGFPWPRIVARLRRIEPRATVEPPTAPASAQAARRTLTAALVLIAALAGLGALPVVRRYTAEHHRNRPSPRDEAQVETPPPSAEVRAFLGGLNGGDTVAGFRVTSIRGPSPGPDRAIDITLGERQATSDTVLVITVTARGTRPYRAPRRSDRYDLFYGDGDLGSTEPTSERRDAALDAVLARIVATERMVAAPDGM